MEYTPPPGYKLLTPEHDDLPNDWKLLESDKGRKFYHSPPPRTLIQTRKQLKDYHDRGKFKELDLSKVTFLNKKNQRKKCYSDLQDSRETNVPLTVADGTLGGRRNNTGGGGGTANLGEGYVRGGIAIGEDSGAMSGVGGGIDSGAVSVGGAVNREVSGGERVARGAVSNDFDMEQDTFEDIEGADVGSGKALEENQTKPPSNSQQKLIRNDLKKITNAVKLLTVDPGITLDHKVELERAAASLSEARSTKFDSSVDFDKIKNGVTECTNMEMMCKLLWEQDTVRTYFQDMQNSAYLEDLIRIGRSYIESPLKTFPPNINQNLYSEIIKYSLLHCRSTVLLLVNLVVDRDKPITTSDVIREAFKQIKS